MTRTYLDYKAAAPLVLCPLAGTHQVPVGMMSELKEDTAEQSRVFLAWSSGGLHKTQRTSRGPLLNHGDSLGIGVNVDCALVVDDIDGGGDPHVADVGAFWLQVVKLADLKLVLLRLGPEENSERTTAEQQGEEVEEAAVEPTGHLVFLLALGGHSGLVAGQ